MKLTDFDVLTFDCYGTLIDWETGIYRALGPLIAASGRDMGRNEALEAFADMESAQEHETPGMIYPDLLAAVHGRLGARWGASPSPDQNAAFGASIPDWPPFADSADALCYLKDHYKLVILSNVDRASFAASAAKLGVDFDAVYTAEDIGSYKPSLNNFNYMLDRLAAMGIAKSAILHTAQSLFHDHAPAKAVGLARCWIDRRGGEDGSGATKAVDEIPDVHFHFDGMAALAHAHRAAQGSRGNQTRAGAGKTKHGQ